MLSLPQRSENGRFPAERRDLQDRCRAADQPHRGCSALLFAVLIAQLCGTPAVAQRASTALACLAPEAPNIDLPTQILATYRAEISAEFESYFTAISEYIACLDGERGRAMTEARDAADAYSVFLNLPQIHEENR